jgi:hypothetical protein
VTTMKRRTYSVRAEVRVAKKVWSDLGSLKLKDLRFLLEAYKLSVVRGEITRIDNAWYVTHAGLLQLSSRRGCRGIRTFLQERLSDPAAARWVFRAVVYKGPKSKGFVGYGDADPSNVSSIVQGAELRVAETRAVNRALRKAYGIGLCSVEELGAFGRQPQSSPSSSASNGSCNGSSGHGQPRLRDQLSLLIRQYNLDSNLVKAYAADFCGTEALSGASRALVESFINHLSALAKENRDALICKLNSYGKAQEVAS